MIGPAYTIPTSRRTENIELGRYVRAEFSDRDCHWFTCRSSAKSVANGTATPGRSWIARVFGAGRASMRDAPPSIVPCAVMVSNIREDDR